MKTKIKFAQDIKGNDILRKKNHFIEGEGIITLATCFLKRVHVKDLGPVIKSF